MAANKIKAAPEPTLRRLPRYLHLLNQMKGRGISEVSSTKIGAELGLDSTQIRKDIEFTDIVGKPKTGFNVIELIKAIESFLSWDILRDTFLVGAGSLGTAMLGYSKFKNYGLNFVAAFDTDELKIGTTINNTPILPIKKMINLSLRMRIQAGVITVPAHAAQAVTDLLVEGGVKAIWNFAPIQVKVPSNVILENAQLTQSLAVLSRKLSELQNEEEFREGMKQKIVMGG